MKKLLLFYFCFISVPLVAQKLPNFGNFHEIQNIDLEYSKLKEHISQMKNDTFTDGEPLFCTHFELNPFGAATWNRFHPNGHTWYYYSLWDDYLEPKEFLGLEKKDLRFIECTYINRGDSYTSEFFFKDGDLKVFYEKNHNGSPMEWEGKDIRAYFLRRELVLYIKNDASVSPYESIAKEEFRAYFSDGKLVIYVKDGKITDAPCGLNDLILLEGSIILDRAERKKENINL